MRIIIVLTSVMICSTAFAGIIEYLAEIRPLQISEEGGVLTTTRYEMNALGKPSIPYECYGFVLPYGETISEIDVVFSEHTVLEGKLNIRPAQLPTLISQVDVAVTIDSEVYGSSELYPQKDSELRCVERLSGFDIAILNVYPYKYSPARKELSYYQQVSIRLRTVSDIGIRAQQSPMVCRSTSVLNRLEKLTVNPAMVESYPEMDKNDFN
ncbi:MAG: hypothetical protein KAT85_08845, partial [candidate division Zixibacteria bacterium]|nr:hypothetical protein [candidate division Zixibacteria bacterium]